MANMPNVAKSKTRTGLAGNCEGATREEALKSVTMGIKLSPKGSPLTLRIAREPVFGQASRPFTIR